MIPDEAYTRLRGPLHHTMPQARREGREPLSVCDILTQACRLPPERATPAFRRNWYFNYTATRDAIAYHPDGRFKIILDAAPILALQRDTSLQKDACGAFDAFDISVRAYDALDGKEFSAEERKIHVRRASHTLTFATALDNPVLQYLLRGKAPDLMPGLSAIAQRYITDNDTLVRLTFAEPVRQSNRWRASGEGAPSSAQLNVWRIGPLDYELQLYDVPVGRPDHRLLARRETH